MEIDLIDNVPCSHCEQLVPCEYNPETSSKNFPPQTFNPSSSFCPSLQKMRRATARRDKGGNPVLSSTNRTGRSVTFGLGSWSKKDNDSKIKKIRMNVMSRRRIDQNSFSIQVLKIHCSSLCLIGNSGSESTAPAQSHLTCQPCQERWHLVDPSSHEGACGLAPT